MGAILGRRLKMAPKRVKEEADEDRIDKWRMMDSNQRGQ